MDEDQRLRNLARWRKAGKKENTVKLGSTLKALMDRRVSPRHSVQASVALAWEHLLPPLLARHCRPAEVKNGILKVKVDSSVYMYELRLCKDDLLEQLRDRCPKAKVKDIRFLME